MRRASFYSWSGWRLLSCVLLCACVEEVDVGDPVDGQRVLDKQVLERASQGLRGTWVGTAFGTRGKLTFEPSRRPRTGAFIADCAIKEDCKPFATISTGDAGSEGPSFQVRGSYQLIESIGDRQMVCLFLTSSPPGQSLVFNLWLSPDEESLEFRASLPAPVFVSFTRE